MCRLFWLKKENLKSKTESNRGSLLLKTNINHLNQQPDILIYSINIHHCKTVCCQMQRLSRRPPCCPWWPCHPASHLARQCDPGLKTSAFMKSINCAGTSSVGEVSTGAGSWRKRCLSPCWQIWQVNLRPYRNIFYLC